MVYTPGHRGTAPNAVAGAVAKAYLGAEGDKDVIWEMIKYKERSTYGRTYTEELEGRRHGKGRMTGGRTCRCGRGSWNGCENGMEAGGGMKGPRLGQGPGRDAAWGRK